VFGGNDRTHVGLGFSNVRGAGLHRLDEIGKGWKQSVPRIADGNRRGSCHAALAGTAESAVFHRFHGAVHVGGGHEDNEIFRTTGGLHLFSVKSAFPVDITGDRRGTDEADCLDVGMFQNGIHAFAAAEHDVHHAGRQARLFQQGDDALHGERDIFAGFEVERVATGDGDGPHPHRDERGEMERTNSGDHSERMAVGVAVDAAGEFRDFDPAPQVASGFGEGFAVFGGDPEAGFFERFVEQDLRPEKDLSPLVRRGVAPCGEGGLRGSHREVNLRSAAHRDARDDAAAGGIEDWAAGFVGGFDPFPADVERTDLVFGRAHGWEIAMVGTIVSD